MDSKALLAREWQTLQDNHEQYERHALLIKLSCIALCTAGLAAHLPLVWVGASVLLLWLQEGIFKTYQGRLAERLLLVEAQLGQVSPELPAMQLHSAWMAQRPGGARLIAEYAISAARPTVAFPYLPILLLGGLATMCSWI
jgi:hypothetical protein